VHVNRTEPISLVEEYLAAVADRDVARARGYLADTGFRYRSPIASFDNADEFAANMEGIAAILHDVRVVHRFMADDTVCHVLDFTVAMTGYQTRRVVQLAEIVDRIASLEVIFDATQFHQMILVGDPP
jgi:arginine/ornithine N-succinyltransferase beta subunit